MSISLDPRALELRLTTLARALDRLPVMALCPWPVARVYNVLLVEARNLAPEDPVMRALATLKEQPGEEETSATVTVGSLQALLDQLILTFGEHGVSVDGAGVQGRPAVG